MTGNAHIDEVRAILPRDPGRIVDHPESLSFFSNHKDRFSQDIRSSCSTHIHGDGGEEQQQSNTSRGGASGDSNKPKITP
jgi:hypothetical protein